MKYGFKLISLLYNITILWLFSSILIILFALLGIMQPNNEYLFKAKSGLGFGINNPFYGGLPMPVSVTVQLPSDTIVKYKNGLQTGEMRLSKGDNFRPKNADSILINNSISKQYYFSKWIVEPSFYDIPSFSEHTLSFSNDTANLSSNFTQKTALQNKFLEVTVAKSFNFETNLNFKVKGWLNTFLLSIMPILSIFMNLFISYNFYKILKQLYHKIAFRNMLYKRLFWVGLAILICEIIKFLLAFIYSKWYGLVKLINETNIEQYKSNVINVTFNPSTTSSFSVLLLGVAVIVLSYIFKYGNALEQERALTI